MSTATPQKTLKRALEVDFSAILVVYKSMENTWKGFAYPYNVTTESDTKTNALATLRGLVEAYEDELKKFNFPSHLVNKSLTDLEDREIFQRVIDDAVAQKGIVDKTSYHAETHKVRS